MGHICTNDNREFQERNLTCYGESEFDNTFMHSEEVDEDMNYDIHREYTFFHQHSKKNYISESDFLKYSKTGDILLYQTNTLSSQLIRTATRSNYDHVAIIIKGFYTGSPSDKVYIFECVSDEGVQITDWDSIRSEIGPDKFYNKVIYRSVNFSRSKYQK